MMMSPFQPINIFCISAPEDRAQLEQLKAHLALLRRSNHIQFWCNQEFSAGTEWRRETRLRLSQAEIILLLISANFFNSDDCYESMEKAIERDQQRESRFISKVRLIPVYLSPVFYQPLFISAFQILPTSGKAVTLWTNQNAAWREVVGSIFQVVNEIRSRWEQRMLLSLVDTQPPVNTYESVLIGNPPGAYLPPPSRTPSGGTPVEPIGSGNPWIPNGGGTPIESYGFGNPWIPNGGGTPMSEYGGIEPIQSDNVVPFMQRLLGLFSGRRRSISTLSSDNQTTSLYVPPQGGRNPGTPPPVTAYVPPQGGRNPGTPPPVTAYVPPAVGGLPNAYPPAPPLGGPPNAYPPIRELPPRSRRPGTAPPVEASTGSPPPLTSYKQPGTTLDDPSLPQEDQPGSP
jgi:hypothetical protein